MARRADQLQATKRTGSSWWMPWPLVALVVVTVANYLWQVPYYMHFYGQFGTSPGGPMIPPLLSFVWFIVPTVLLLTRRRGGVPVMASFLVVETLFYLVHNASGAAGRDLLTGDDVLLIASLLGYLKAAAAVLFLGWLFTTHRKARHD